MLKLTAGLELGFGCVIYENLRVVLGPFIVFNNNNKMEDVQNCKSHLVSGLTTMFNYSLETSKSDVCSGDDW
jgi:hypothetical protein